MNTKTKWTSRAVETTGEMMLSAKSSRESNWADSAVIFCREGGSFSLCVYDSEGSPIAYVFGRKTLTGCKRTAERMLGGWWFPRDICPEGHHEFWRGTRHEQTWDA